MADTNSTQYAKQVDAPNTYAPLQPNEYLGKVQASFFQHTCESEGIGDTISLCKVPPNARVLAILWASDDLSAGSATLDIGDSGDADRLVADAAISAALAYAPLTLRSPTTETPDVGFGYEYTAETVITGTVVTAALNTGKLWGAVLYVAQ
jgi:hypothetical protein